MVFGNSGESDESEADEQSRLQDVGWIQTDQTNRYKSESYSAEIILPFTRITETITFINGDERTITYDTPERAHSALNFHSPDPIQQETETQRLYFEIGAIGTGRDGWTDPVRARVNANPVPVLKTIAANEMYSDVEQKERLAVRAIVTVQDYRQKQSDLDYWWELLEIEEREIISQPEDDYTYTPRPEGGLVEPEDYTN